MLLFLINQGVQNFQDLRPRSSFLIDSLAVELYINEDNLLKRHGS
jgi:hypothetical protein